MLALGHTRRVGADWYISTDRTEGVRVTQILLGHPDGQGCRWYGSLTSSGLSAPGAAGAGASSGRYGVAVRAETNAGAFGVPHPVVAS
jgi:hypothetical protein